jgi:hypothetical protein
MSGNVNEIRDYAPHSIFNHYEACHKVNGNRIKQIQGPSRPSLIGDNARSMLQGAKETASFCECLCYAYLVVSLARDIE